MITEPDGFDDDPKVPSETRVCVAAINRLITDSGMTNAGILRTAEHKRITQKTFSYQMLHRPAGPSRELYEVILAAIAPQLQVPIETLHAQLDPLWQAAQDAVAARRQQQRVSKLDNPIRPELWEWSDSAEPVTEPDDASFRQRRDGATAWLLTLLSGGEQDRAARELPETIGPDRYMLVTVLVEVGRRDPGAVAALLDSVAEVHGSTLSNRMRDAIRERDQDVALAIDAVPRPQPDAGVQLGILNLSPAQLIGRRLAATIQRGDLDQAHHEFDAVLAHSPRLEGPSSIDVLTGIIDSGRRGPALAAQLLTAMIDNGEVDNAAGCTFGYVERWKRSSERAYRVHELLHALSPYGLGRLDVFTAMLIRFCSRRPAPYERMTPPAPVTLLLNSVGCNEQLAMLLTCTALTSSNVAAGYLVESIPDLHVMLRLMLTRHPAGTARLLAKALSEWQTSATEPERLEPVQRTARAVLAISNDNLQVVVDLLLRMIRDDARDGLLLFHSIQSEHHPMFGRLLTELIAPQARIDALAGLIIATSDDIRLRMFEHLAKDHPEKTVLIVASIVKNHTSVARALLPRAVDRAPVFASRIMNSIGDQENSHSRRTQWNDAAYLLLEGHTQAVHEFLERMAGVTDHDTNTGSWDIWQDAATREVQGPSSTTRTPT